VTISDLNTPSAKTSNGTTASTLRLLTSRDGKVQVLNTWWAGLIAYLLGAVGVTLFAIQLSGVVFVHAMILGRPLLEGSPPKLSLIQQRRIDAALALPPSRELTNAHVVATEATTVPPEILAAQLDLSEQADSPMVLPRLAAIELHSEPSSVATEASKLRVARSRTRYMQMTAADIFNRSFGVLTAAGN
jgi:hypothetical protein